MLHDLHQLPLENTAGAKYCIECGEAFRSRCLKCGSVNTPNAKFCQERGTLVQLSCRAGQTNKQRRRCDSSKS